MNQYKTVYLEEKYIEKYILFIRCDIENIREELMDFIINKQNDTEFIILVVNENEDIYFSAKLNYNFKYSKNGSYDLYIQDLVFHDHIQHKYLIYISIDTFISDFKDLLFDYENKNHFIVDKRIILLNSNSSAFSNSFIYNGFQVII
jgi:hypothetical protein